jgi:hypothetical protein
MYAVPVPKETTFGGPPRSGSKPRRRGANRPHSRATAQQSQACINPKGPPYPLPWLNVGPLVRLFAIDDIGLGDPVGLDQGGRRRRAGGTSTTSNAGIGRQCRSALSSIANRCTSGDSHQNEGSKTGRIHETSPAESRQGTRSPSEAPTERRLQRPRPAPHPRRASMAHPVRPRLRRPPVARECHLPHRPPT